MLFTHTLSVCRGTRLANLQHFALRRGVWCCRAPDVRVSTLVLPFGRFYGRPDVRLQGSDFECAILDADPYRVVERHTHEEAHFVLVLEGLYVSSAAGADAVSRGPVLVFNPAGTTHRDRFEASSGTLAGRFLTLSIAPSLIQDATRGRRIPTEARVVRDRHAVETAFALAQASTATSAVTLAVESLMLNLVDAVVTSEPSDRRAPPPWLRVATELLSDSGAQTPTISEIAAVAGVHRVHLARAFRTFHGCSPATFQRQRRLERAAGLIRHSRRSLSDIALSCGFVDQSHMTTAFRRHHGVTPAEWRRASDTA